MGGRTPIGATTAPNPTDRGIGIAFGDVRKAFGEVVALDGITFEIARHSRIGIVGPSGGGKSTLLQLTAGLMAPTSGTVNVEGETTEKGRLGQCAMMPQRDLLLPWRTALDNAVIALENHGMSRRDARAKAKPFFERFGLGQFENVLPGQLSGGMRQRVSFLRTLMAEKDVVLLDEPFGALDSITRGQMQEWLLNALGDVPRTVLLVTHDVEEALLLSRTVVVMSAQAGPRRHRDRLRVAERRPVAARDRHEPGVREAQGSGAGGARMSTQAPAQPSADATVPPEVAGAKRPSRFVSFWKAYGLSVLFLLLLLAIWEFCIWFFHVPKYLLPAPSGIAKAMTKDWSRYLLPNLWPSLIEILVGFAIAVVAGVGLAVVLHLYGPLRRAVYPLLIGSQTIPIVVLAPILVILLGYNLLPKVVIVALICFFPIVVNGLDGLRLVDDDFIHMMRTLDATRWDIFRKVEFPGALPSIFSGMRVAATFAAIGAVFGEWSGASEGLGYLIQASTPNLQTARIFACILLLTLIAMALFGLVSLLERLLCPWVSRGGAM